MLGRKPECDVTVPCSSVSGRHCALELDDGWWWVRDLGSKNGTTVNGRRGERLRIAPGDVLTVGRQRLMVDYRRVKQSPTYSPARNAEEDLAFEFLSSGEDKNPSDRPNPVSTAGQWSQASTSPTNPAPSPARPTPASDLGKLVPCGGGAPIPLRQPEVIVGRSRECDVRLKYPSISSRHCKLSIDDGYWVVEDLNSTNGTWVDGDRCIVQCLLPESVLALDKHRFTILYVPQSDGPPPFVRQLFSQSLLEKAGLAKEFQGDRLAGHVLPSDEDDRPKKYTLSDDDD